MKTAFHRGGGGERGGPINATVYSSTIRPNAHESFIPVIIRFSTAI